MSDNSFLEHRDMPLIGLNRKKNSCEKIFEKIRKSELCKINLKFFDKIVIMKDYALCSISHLRCNLFHINFCIGNVKLI